MPSITGLAYADLLVRPATAETWLDAWQALGFHPAGSVHTPDTDGYTLRRPGTDAQLILSVARPGGSAATDLDKYGEGVRDLAFFTPDVTSAYQAMTRAGAAPVFESGWTLTGSQIAVAGGIGRLRHTLLQTPAPLARTTTTGFDHVAVTVPAGELTAARVFYSRAGFGWEPGQVAGDRDNGTVTGTLTAGSAVLTLTSPNPRNGLLERFLGTNGGVPAVQHLALATGDISRLADDAGEQVRWAPPPPEWDRHLPHVLPDLPDLHLLIARGVIASRDPEGRVLRQLCTLPLVDGCGLHAEIIQRRDPLGGPPAGGFGHSSLDLLAGGCNVTASI